MFKPVSKYLFPYNEGQLKALEIGGNFLKGKEWGCFVLGGPAGSGKTEVSKDLVKLALEEGTVCVTAPTHKAKRVIESVTNIKGRTVHQLLRIKPNYSLDNFDINNIKFDNSRYSHEYMADYKTVLVDEAPMVGTKLQKYLESRAKYYGTKILYVGDPYQLAPIKENKSPVFHSSHLTYNLKDVIRQDDDNPTMDLLNLLRYDIDHRTSEFIKELYLTRSKKSSKGAGYWSYDSNSTSEMENFKTLIINHFSSKQFENNINFCRFTAYTNEIITAWNKYIRNKVLDSPKEILISSDLLVCYKTIVDSFMSPIIINSEEYAVDKCEKLNRMQHNIEGFKVTLINLSDGSVTTPLFVVNTTHIPSRNSFLKHHNKLHQTARNSNPSLRYRNWTEYFDFKNNHLLIEEIRDTNGKIILDDDLGYGFGITTHKAQGSTYDTVFVDVRNMIYTKNKKVRPDIDMRNRLLYVAASRAKNKVIFKI